VPIGVKNHDSLLRAVRFSDDAYQYTTINGFAIAMLTERDFIYQSFEHIFRHLMHDRITLRNLCDMVMLFIKVRCEDWTVYYEVISACGMGALFSGLVSVLVFEFGLSPDLVKGIPLIDVEQEKIFLTEILSVPSARVGINQYYASLNPASKLSMLWGYMKAVSRDILIKYPYCRKTALLRPVAFIHAYADYARALLGKMADRHGT